MSAERSWTRRITYCTGDDHDDIYTNIVEPGQQDLSRDQMEPEDGLVGCPASLGGRNGIE